MSCTSKSEMPKKRRLVLAIIGVSLLVHVALGLHTAASKTITHDEIWHLPVGMLNLQTGRFDYDDLNPPLTRIWSGIPGCLFGPKVDERPDGTAVAREFVREIPQHRTWYVWGRVFNLLLSVTTILLVCRWAWCWFGEVAAAMATLLCCTEPNLLAHASLVTPDAGLMLGFVATLYALSRWWDRPTWTASIVLGVVTGLTQGTKFTAILLFGLVLLVGALALLRPRVADITRRRVLWQFLAALTISLFAWNATYLFRGTGRPLESYQFLSQSMQSLQSTLKPVGRLPVPLPESYLTGIDRQRSVMEQQHPVFLDGEWSLQGFPAYFVMTLLYKLSHGLQGLILLGLGVCFLRRGVQRRLDMLVLWVLPCVLLLGVASLSSMQLGVRYVLPLLPLMILLTGPLAAWISRQTAPVQWMLGVAVVVAALLPLRHHPNHLAYFNELAGGPLGGRYHLLDSNIDWGQDLHLVKEFMEQQGLQEIGLVYFGTLPPDILGINFHVSPGRRPQAGWHAVSVNFVMGRPHVVPLPEGGGRSADINEFGYFRAFEPVTTLGGSIDIYHIESR